MYVVLPDQDMKYFDKLSVCVVLDRRFGEYNPLPFCVCLLYLSAVFDSACSTSEQDGSADGLCFEVAQPCRPGARVGAVETALHDPAKLGAVA